MTKRVGLLLAISLLLGCDAEVGREPCTGLSCAEPPDSLLVELMVSYVRVSTQAPLDLPIVSTVQSPCELPCSEPVRLFRASSDAGTQAGTPTGTSSAWTLSRAGGPPTLQLLAASNTMLRDAPLVFPDGSQSFSSLYVNSGLDGNAVAHVSWNMPRGGTFNELASISAPGVVTRVPLASSRSRPPRGVLAAPSGFLLFDAPPELKPGAVALDSPIPTGTLRLVDTTGATVWQQARLLKGATYVSAAVALSQGFVVGAGEDSTASARFGVLSVDAAGNLTRFGISSDSTWHSTRLLSLGPDVYAVAAESQLDAVVDTANTGNIDVMIDRGELGTLTGFRLERACLFELTLYGFSADDQGNLYVSSVTGEKDAPRGLLCELPVEGHPRCFQGPPNQLFGEIVATGGGSLFVVAGDQILLTQLPP